MKKLFLAFQRQDCEPFAYIFAETEELAKQKAFEVAKEKWEYYKNQDIPCHEMRNIKDIKEVQVYHPKEDIYDV